VRAAAQHDGAAQLVGAAPVGRTGDADAPLEDGLSALRCTDWLVG
jgi:hypothetical protein